MSSSRVKYEPVPSKIPGVGLPSLIGTPCRDTTTKLNRSGSISCMLGSFWAALGTSGP